MIYNYLLGNYINILKLQHLKKTVGSISSSKISFQHHFCCMCIYEEGNVLYKSLVYQNWSVKTFKLLPQEVSSSDWI